MPAHPAAGRFARRAVVLAPGEERPFVDAEWLDTLVVVMAGSIEVETWCGARLTLLPGDVAFLTGLSVRLLRNRGRESVVLDTVRRRPRGAPADESTPGRRSGDMLYRSLGRTGVEVSAIGFGGSHFAKKALSEAQSIELVHAAIDRGITFMDNCWDYNDGQSEIRMGKALAQGGRRAKVFLETKIDGRTADAARKQIDESLRRLKTDHLDLLMHHEVLRFDDPDRIFAEGGAQEAVEAARKAGKVRFIGFTGHKDPHVHLYMLDVAKKHGVRFDAVLMPSNVMDAHFRSFAQLVMPRLVS
ncbi:MAG: aldo/keto reductase, partial [Actinomycetota bacterium]